MRFLTNLTSILLASFLPKTIFRLKKIFNKSFSVMWAPFYIKKGEI